MKPSESEIRAKFFELLFEDQQGFLCLATTEMISPRASFKQRFFEWPGDWREIEKFILVNENKRNLYFCVSLLNKRERKKENCLESSFLWADLDNVDPGSLDNFTPPISVESSEGRWQAYWRLSVTIAPLQAEEYSRRLAYHTGSDTSGWDMVQLLRVPLTYNYKHDPPQLIHLRHASEVKAPPLLFEKLLAPTQPVDIALPTDDDLPTVEQVMYHYQNQLRGTRFEATYTQEPDDGADWSSILWKLHHICLTAGMSVEETFVVAKSAPSNKYARDGRPDEHLWQEILKAQASRNGMNLPDEWKPLKMPHFIDEPASETFVDEYLDWAQDATDAVPEYHKLAAFMILSSVVSTSVRLPARHKASGIVPNLYGLILGDSTLSRKTTAMDMARDLIMLADTDTIIATDGTAEGLVTSLEQRPGKTSVFFIDEVSGFFASINKKEYHAGMREFLTKLYDAPQVLKRTLRKEEIMVNSPLFIMFCGGITDHVYENTTEDYVISGFLPRFLVVTGEANLDNIRNTQRPIQTILDKHSALRNKVADMYELYAADVPTKIGGQTVMQSPRIVADLDDRAWKLSASIEDGMRREAASYQPSRPAALATFERISDSVLKMAVLLGASRQHPSKKNTITINSDDVANAAYYVQRWAPNSVDLIMHAGVGAAEKKLQKIVSTIEENPGIMRSRLMTRFRLSQKQADDVLITIVQRGLAQKTKTAGGGDAFWPL